MDSNCAPQCCQGGGRPVVRGARAPSLDSRRRLTQAAAARHPPPARRWAAVLCRRSNHVSGYSLLQPSPAAAHPGKY
ncbi:hypothetical protein E2C01_102675 [Portunus trituberculatus]|uniref:Uncharacterized protein n=1 Tax=Portunus trituberculatus TaxID=210409 RepID=A0A5B7KIX1_PORTR|nr:hypothetical protein [Portunus trituberculatus]